MRFGDSSLKFNGLYKWPRKGDDDIPNAEVVAEAPAGDAKREKKSPLQFLKSKLTRKNLSAAGMSLFLSYGFVSNVNSAAMMGWVWAKYVKDTGMSPFLGWHPPFVTPKFLAYYGAIYITLGSLLRPVRAAIATGISPFFNRIIEGLQENFKFSKPMAIFTVIFMGNIVFTIGWLLFNLRVACWVFRVPVAPAAAL